jgi:hypothetical protein
MSRIMTPPVVPSRKRVDADSVHPFVVPLTITQATSEGEPAQAATNVDATIKSGKAFIVFLLRPNAAVQPQIRAQREFVGWNCLLEAGSFLARLCGKSH